MNLILLFEQDRRSHDRFLLSGTRAEHIRTVLCARPGDELSVGLLEGPRGSGRVVSIGEAIELECTFEDGVEERPLVDLILAIPRPKSLKKLLPEVAALGIDRLILLRTWRVAKPYLSTDVLKPRIYEPLFHEGLMQSMTTRMPQVTVEPLFKPFVEDRLPAFAGTKLVAHPYAALPLYRLPIAKQDRLVLVIGPEGGLLPYEIEALERAGCRSVHIGPRILRVETACVALLAQISLMRAAAGELSRS